MSEHTNSSSMVDDMKEIKRLADNILSSTLCFDCNRELLGGGFMGSELCSFCYKDKYREDE